MRVSGGFGASNGRNPPPCGVRTRTIGREDRQIGGVGALERRMGIVISLADRLPARRRGPGEARPRVAFSFDLASPWTYLAAERVDRLFVGVHWRPAFADVLPGPLAVADPARTAGRDAADRAATERRAGELRLPLVWPDRAPDGRQAMRVAALAAEQHRAAPFVLAAGRLAFCGGFDLDDPETIAEAAAAAGLGLVETFAAASDVGRDGALEEAARRLMAQGADELPVLTVGRTLFVGEHRIAEAAAASLGAGQRRQTLG
jgi:2-hydroxychromene-2-carboxylate isomerase